VRLSHHILELSTQHEFHIARARAPTVRRNVWVRIEDAQGIEGWGEAAPNAYYAETADTVQAALERMRTRLVDVDTLDENVISSLERELVSITPGAAAARAAVSVALFDLLGKRRRRPVYDLFGLDPARAPRSSFTIGLDALEMMRERVRAAASYELLKVKVGTPNDEAILAMLRAERPDAIVRVDANTAWTRAQALQSLPMLVDYRVELLEQPLPADDYEGLALIRAAARMPIIADESCRVARDVAALAGCVDGVNIKLAKCGSLLEAMRIAEAARQRQMQVMVGCMVESTLGIAGAVQLAALADYADLDGAALLARDFFTGPGLEPDGRLRFNREPGLGVQLIEHAGP
jgi:L-alanine-DL-glutamate epimerase-like enolase superfamily enzyme